MILELDNCQNVQSAKLLQFQPVFLPKKLFKSQRGEKIYMAELISFAVEVLDQGLIGNIQSFQSNKHQDFLLVQQKEKASKIPIPFVSSYIKNINFPEKTIVLDLPEDFLKIFND